MTIQLSLPDTVVIFSPIYILYFLYVITFSVTYGSQDPTTDHFLYECEQLRQERNYLTTTIRKTDM
jgi:hypothetical protein